ncbi:hypothetical protein RN001_008518 [Aquatica leii]|uniref:Uncharacterized protein n=1 Tax=Aquatica leii TaxID=1421715 RepID=A0AAN7PZ77_9COLE|nr:hypothetical protein RN001_008518 [Aquatica leii]
MTLTKLFFLSLFLASTFATEIQPKYLNLTSIDIAKLFPPLSNIDNIEDFFQLKKAQVAILNEYAKVLFAQINKYITDQGIDPLKMQDLIESFQWTIFSGEMSLKNGFLAGINTITGSGDVTFSYTYPVLKLHLPLSFNLLQLQYDYKIVFMNIGPSGKLKGTVKGCKYTIDIDLDLTTVRAKLTNFKLNTLGNLKLKFEGGIVEWIVNIFLSVAIPLVTPIIALVLDGFLEPSVVNLIQLFNNFMDQTLGPPLP